MASEVNENICHGRYCWLNLRVRAEIDYGETIYIRPASSSELEHSPLHEWEMVTSPSEWPIWHTPKPILVPRGVPFRYSYAISSGGEFVGWEKFGTRSIEPTTPRMEVEDDGFSKEGLVENLSSLPALAKEDVSTLSSKLVGKKLVVACYHLPVNISRVVRTTPGEDGDDDEWSVTWNDSLISKSTDSVADCVETCWLGTVQVGDVSEREQASIRRVLKEMDCVPIFAPTKMLEEAYLGYCKQILWPSFHNVDLLDLSHSFYMDHTGSAPEETWDVASARNYWNSFVSLNELFVTELTKIISVRDVVWVHDYHLMLVPQMLRNVDQERFRRPPTTTTTTVAPSSPDDPPPPPSSSPDSGTTTATTGIRIVFFIHIPFPTSQIFRSLQHGNQLISSMLCADVVGFHAFTHARHFLTTCKRNLGTAMNTLSGGLLQIEHQGHNVCVVIRHVSVETDVIDRKLQSSSRPHDLCTAIMDAHPILPALEFGPKKKKFLIAGIDVCQRLSGVALKLIGFEYFLDQYPDYRDKVVLIQKCMKPNSRPQDEEQSSKEVREVVDRINEKYGPVVEYSEVEKSRIDFDERMALWLSSDVLLNMSVREGLNLDHLEYVYVKDNNPGVVVASEFCSTVSVLNGALQTNPFDAKGIAEALDKALTMDDEERQSRRHRDLPYVNSNTSACWTRQILSDMLLAVKLGSEKKSGLGDGEKEALKKFDETDHAHLDTRIAREAYKASSNRVIVFDYKALRDNESVTKYIKEDINPCHKGRSLPAAIERSLSKLSSDPNNLVVIVSTLTQKNLEAIFKHLPQVHLAASNGLMYTNVEGGVARDSLDRRWMETDTRLDWRLVKEISLPILTAYTERTNGTTIRVREPSLAWSYFRADPEWGASQATQLTSELDIALEPYNAEAIKNTDTNELEIMPMDFHRGVVVHDILQARKRSTDRPIDFFLIMGHHKKDEKIFSSTLSFVAEQTEMESGDPNIFLCTDTKRASIAKAYLEDVGEINHLLEILSKTTVDH